MSEYISVIKNLAASEAYVSPETSRCVDLVSAREVRLKATTGAVACLAKYVDSDFVTEAHNDDFTVNLAANEYTVRQLNNAGVYRFEVTNTSDINPAGVGIVFSSMTTTTKKPLIKRGVKRFSHGTTRRSA